MMMQYPSHSCQSQTSAGESIGQLRQQVTRLQHERDEALTGNQAKSDYLAQLSHEIRNPLNSVLGCAELLLQTSPSPEQQEMLGVIQQSGHALLTLVSDALDLAKIEANRIELAAEKFSPKQSARAAIDILKPRAAAKGLLLSFTVDDSVPQGVIGDEARLRQVFINLLDNAIKFTESGNVTLSMSAERNTEADGYKFRIEVADTGRGMTPLEKKSIFKPFAQLKMQKGNAGGSGLGLVISREICRLMEGDLTVNSRPGEGSIFVVEVSFKGAPGTDSVAGSEPVKRFDNRFAKEYPLEILIVDDVPANRFVLTHMLKRLGYQSHAVEGGKEALRALQERAYDLVFMDIQMPGMDGYECTRAIRQAMHGTAASADHSVVIVAVTADAMQQDRERCFQAGMDDYLPKPIQRESIKAILSKVSAKLSQVSSASPDA